MVGRIPVRYSTGRPHSLLYVVARVAGKSAISPKLTNSMSQTKVIRVKVEADLGQTSHRSGGPQGGFEGNGPINIGLLEFEFRSDLSSAVSIFELFPKDRRTYATDGGFAEPAIWIDDHWRSHVILWFEPHSLLVLELNLVKEGLRRGKQQ